MEETFLIHHSKTGSEIQHIFLQSYESSTGSAMKQKDFNVLCRTFSLIIFKLKSSVGDAGDQSLANCIYSPRVTYLIVFRSSSPWRMRESKSWTSGSQKQNLHVAKVEVQVETWTERCFAGSEKPPQPKILTRLHSRKRHRSPPLWLRITDLDQVPTKE